MKDIKDMNLAELANKLCDLHEGDTVGLLRIADRMDKLHDLTRWIPVSERMPESEKHTWSNPVLALCENGRVYTICCMGDYWERRSEMVKESAGHVLAWKELDWLEAFLELPERITPPEDK
jgi:hypothetical protein